MAYEKMQLADGAQMSTVLADLVIGEHEFPREWDHEQRVMAVTQLLSVYNMVRELGDFEHTGDWDWRISVEAYLGGRTFVLGTQEDPDGDGKWADEFRWPESYSVKPNDYTTQFAAWKFIEVEEFPSPASDEAAWHAVAVDHITVIHIGFA